MHFSCLRVNTLRPRQDGRHFADDIFKCIFLNENAWISLEISLKFVPKVRINNIPALVQIMAWRRPGDKPLSEPMMDNLLTHICVTQPQWVKAERWSFKLEGSSIQELSCLHKDFLSHKACLASAMIHDISRVTISCLTCGLTTEYVLK